MSIFVTGTVERWARLDFVPVESDLSDPKLLVARSAYTGTSGTSGTTAVYYQPQSMSDPRPTVTTTAPLGTFKVELQSGYYRVLSDDVRRWTIFVPATSGTYPIYSLAISIEEGGAAGTSGSSGTSGGSERERTTFTQLQPVSEKTIEHGLRDANGQPRHPSAVTLRRVSGEVFYAPIKDLDVEHTRVKFNNTTAFIAEFV